MNDEYYDLYKADPDFKNYVDRWCKARNLSIFEAFRMKILQEYAQCLKKKREGEV